jgi:hypothetical protein
LVALQDLNLLVKSPSTAPLPFSQVRKALRLIVDDIDDAAPNDISYVYSGYAPLSIRLVQCVTQKNAILSVGASTAGNEDDQPVAGGKKKREVPKAYPVSGWKGFEDVMGSIPGATVDTRQKADKLPGQGMLYAAILSDTDDFQHEKTSPPLLYSSWVGVHIQRSRH